MARLIALIPEDGWAMIRDTGTLFFVRPPFDKQVPLSESALAYAVAVAGYELVPDAPDEQWEAAIDRIRSRMARTYLLRDQTPRC